MRTLIPALVIAFAARASAQLLPEPTAERCTAAPASAGTAASWLSRAAAAVLPATDGRVLKYRVLHYTPLWEQSDRTYEPFIPSGNITDRWLDPATGVEARQSALRPLAAGSFPGQLFSATSIYGGRDSTIRTLGAQSATTMQSRLENPWVVLAEWRADAANARVAQRCRYRDAWRVVLERGADRLYLSESDAVPVKLERVEPHYLWGQVRTEYAWSTWWGVAGGGLFPYSTSRSFDGAIYERIGITAGGAGPAIALIPRDSAPRLTIPDGLPPAPAPPPAMISPTPDTVRIGRDAYLLVTPQYTETVVLRRDTVFLLDATSNEARARGDSTMIAALFPGKHPTVVVVSDLAWPHISGLRFWVGRGATVVSHAAAEAFLRRVIARRWTLEPDALEKRRASSPFRFRAVHDSLRLAGGDLVVHALRGSTTELAVATWLPEERYLWAGDYVQNGGDSPYARDVIRTARDLGLTPSTVGAQHIRLTPWEALVARTPH